MSRDLTRALLAPYITAAPAPLSCPSCGAYDPFPWAPNYLGGPGLENEDGEPTDDFDAPTEVRWNDWRCALCNTVTTIFWRRPRTQS